MHKARSYKISQIVEISDENAWPFSQITLTNKAFLIY